MAMSVVYTTINGQIVSENRGGVVSNYAPDNLGSTVALLDSTGTVTDTFTYWPYGEIQSHVGSSVTPFTFCGTIGYYLDVLGSQVYVRARYLRLALARWQTLDPLWPRQSPYVYAGSRPTVQSDPSGLAPCTGLNYGQVRAQPRPCIYGNYCGPCNGNNGSDSPVDQLDSCCQSHDNCMATVWDWLDPYTSHVCQCKLCWCALNANCHWSFGCNAARAAIVAWACEGCVGLISWL